MCRLRGSICTCLKYRHELLQRLLSFQLLGCQKVLGTCSETLNIGLILLQAAVDAGMRCVITYTNSSKTQGFKGAELIVGNLNANSHSVSIEGLLQAKELFDDRTVAAT